MRWCRGLVVALAALLVAQLAPPAAAANNVRVDVVALVDNQGPFSNVTLSCRAAAGAGATATTIWCEVWDSATTSISHLRLYPGSVGLCHFKANQLFLPLVYCVRAVAEFASGPPAADEECHEVSGSPAPRPPTTARTTFECVEPVPLPI